MAELVKLKVRTHLVSFLFQELEGETRAVYKETKVKLADISRSSLLGKMIETFKELAGKPCHSDLVSFSVFLRISEDGDNTGQFFERHNKEHELLELSPEHNFIINETLESMFRVSAVEFIKGYSKGSTSQKFVNEAIHEFMKDHNLYETEIDPESIRRFYYNALKKNHSLSRLQNQIGNRSLYYYSA